MKETIKKNLEKIPPDIYIETASAAIIALLLSGVGQEYFDQGVISAAYIGNILVYGLMYPAVRRREEGDEIVSLLGIAEMVTRSIAAAASPFLIAGAIQNPEVIVNIINWIDQRIGIKEGIPSLIDGFIKGVAENGPNVAKTTGKVIGGIALAAGGLAGTIWTLKQAGNKLVKAYQVSSIVISKGVSQAAEFARSFELSNPFEEAISPVKIEFRNPKIKPMIRRKSD
ncbi:MAG: hypothetical protein GW942_02200 [Candidatus Pacebacteria bacterium]|nr:hypothetical protein [Candidatus Paceibacterota bacterium]